ncbi:hypothetical protein HLB44_01655 [Aquincola sp. S2]|uniref:Uncharacterized protein n=1 Tax=Pseudaquabacterium terrae TaxID=2732868 RepID=A0ABX2EAZ1_9BURK|nr:hypothetical protein [Aquabacterium terrae]NRF65681.1 hypothetical protein [Aquabacterium terrae]
MYELREVWLVAEGRPQQLICRWVTLPRMAKSAHGSALAWAAAEKACTVRFTRDVRVIAEGELAELIAAHVGAQGAFELRRGKDNVTGPAREGTPFELLMGGGVFGKGVLVLLEGDTAVAEASCQGEPMVPATTTVFTLKAASQDADLPCCLRVGSIERGGEPLRLDVLPSVVESCPTAVAAGYWPLLAIYLQQSLQDLRAAVEFALAQTGCKARCIPLPDGKGNSTFARDYWINLCGRKALVSLGTSKYIGGSWVGDSPPGALLSRLPPGDTQESLGFGGNFLTCEGRGQSFLVSGTCGHGRNRTGVLGALASQLAGSIDAILLDTGWLCVGHVDEIVSFPKKGVAFVASPDAFKEACGAAPGSLPDDALNTTAQAKLTAIAALLKDTAGQTIVHLPVWFKRGPKGRLTTVNGNAVNCIYIGKPLEMGASEGPPPIAIHACSGLTLAAADQHERFGPRNAVDRMVADRLKAQGFISLFVDMHVQNNEEGAGGNVHCATYTVHEMQ